MRFLILTEAIKLMKVNEGVCLKDKNVYSNSTLFEGMKEFQNK